MKNNLCTNEEFIVKLGSYIGSVPCLDYIKDNQLTLLGTFTLIALSIKVANLYFDTLKSFKK